MSPYTTEPTPPAREKVSTSTANAVNTSVGWVNPYAYVNHASTTQEIQRMVMTPNRMGFLRGRPSTQYAANNSGNTPPRPMKEAIIPTATSDPVRALMNAGSTVFVSTRAADTRKNTPCTNPAMKFRR